MSTLWGATFRTTLTNISTRGFTWQEAGINVRPERSTRLEENYRNTVEIAKFAAPLVTGIPLDEDSTLPDFSKCTRRGSKPIVLRGKFSAQASRAIRHIKKEVDLTKESVVFLHPKGGGWYDDIQRSLTAAGLDYVEITRESAWPSGPENIALSTFHSAKGLEFDHVIAIGLNAELLPHGEEDDDESLNKLRRLLAMGIGRARNTVVLGYKPHDASKLFDYLNPSTYKVIDL